jgi:hypothetical protein
MQEGFADLSNKEKEERTQMVKDRRGGVRPIGVVDCHRNHTEGLVNG